MKKRKLFASLLCLTLLYGCGESPSGNILDGDNPQSKWELSGKSEIKDNMLLLSGDEAKAFIKNGDYKDFSIRMDVMTSPGAHGAVCFHTDKKLGKGYEISIDNDMSNENWWTKTGSLLFVRNIIKPLASENEWFKMEIDVKGKKIQVFVNNTPVVEYVEPLKPYRIEANKNMLLSKGLLAFVNNSNGLISIKNLEIEIPDKASYEIDKQLSEAIDEETDPIIKLHQDNFPVVDYHVHLKGGLNKEQAKQQSRKLGINYCIAPNCGLKFPISTNDEIISYLDTMRTEPFVLAMQAEGREWVDIFSQEARDEFDYVFTDAMTIFDHKGRRSRLWIPEETFVDVDHQTYMDMMVDRICGVLKEPADIYVNPCYLPEDLQKDYDSLWTEDRMNKFIDALVESGKALEINELYNIPNKAILQKAKDAGVKFTFGSNNVTPNVSDLSYSLKMKEELGLKAEDMYKPNIKLK
jgi:hypothetical protein